VISPSYDVATVDEEKPEAFVYVPAVCCSTFIHSFHSQPYDRSIASSTVDSPHSAVWCLLSVSNIFSNP